MKKMKVIALVAALVLGFCVYKYMGELNKPTEEPRVNVVVCAVDIPENTTITADMVRTVAVLEESVLANAVTDVNSVVGMVMNSDMYAGEQVLSSRLVRLGATDAASNSLAYVIEPGMRAVTVAVNTTSGLENHIRPGNSVDVVMYYTTEGVNGGEGESVANYLMQNITVLAVGNTLNKGSAAPEGYGTVTLMVTPEQALDLSFVEQYHALRLIMRSSVDEDVVEVGEIVLDSIVG